jgi:antitoxin component HigA of HigAB toxin-antitoxin module
MMPNTARVPSEILAQLKRPSIPIKTDAEYHVQHNLMSQLLNIIGENEQHPDIAALDRVSDAIAEYEKANYPILESTPAELFCYLVEEHGLTDKDLSHIMDADTFLRISLSDLAPTQEHAVHLAALFSVSPSLFTDIPDYGKVEFWYHANGRPYREEIHHAETHNEVLVINQGESYWRPFTEIVRAERETMPEGAYRVASLDLQDRDARVHVRRVGTHGRVLSTGIMCSADERRVNLELKVRTGTESKANPEITTPEEAVKELMTAHNVSSGDLPIVMNFSIFRRVWESLLHNRKKSGGS